MVLNIKNIQLNVAPLNVQQTMKQTCCLYLLNNYITMHNTTQHARIMFNNHLKIFQRRSYSTKTEFTVQKIYSTKLG